MIHAKTLSGPFDNMFKTRFVDLSHYENCNFDMLDLKKLFVTKCTEGIFVKDAFFENYKKECKKRNIPFAAYHFFRCSLSPSNQADFFIRNIADAYPILDIESLDGVSFDKVEGLILVWLEKVEKATGKIPVIYSGFSFLQSCKFSKKLEKYPLWLARYCSFVPTAPSPWKDWVAWQYTDKGIVAGIGDCDVNYLKGDIWI